MPRIGPCKYCRRTHHKRCWKRYAEKKAARQALKKKGK